MMKRYVYIQMCLLFMLLASAASAQQSTIKGYLQNTYGDPVEGATITLIENPSIKTTSNAKGIFTIQGEVGQHVRVTKKNQFGKTVPITQKRIEINLGNSSQQIPIGYGEVRGPDELTAAVGVIGSSQILKNSSVINPANALYGKIPGLTVLENGGAPPTNPSLFIRGRETFTNSSPLILVDGFERPLSSVTPGAIKSVEILKDAAAVAVYGQRGANGVVLVTTKRGSSHPLQVHASFDQIVTQPTELPDFLRASAYARALNEAQINDGLTSRYSQEDLEAFDTGNSPYFHPNVDWFNEVLRNYGTRSNFDVTFDGGGDRARYFAIMRYTHDNGIFGPVNHNDGYTTQKKYGTFNFRTNLDIDLTDNLLLRANVGGYIFDSNDPRGTGNIFNALYSIPSAAFPVKTPDGNWGGTQIYGNNPLAMLTSTGYGSPNGREFFVDGILRQDLNDWVDGLTIELGVSYTDYASYFQQEAKQYQYESITPIRDNTGTIIDTTTAKYEQNTNLNFSDSFGTKRLQSNITAKLNYAESFGDDDLEVMALFHQDGRTLSGRDNVYHRRNFAGNIHYSLNDRYYFNIAASYSGNNVLPEGDKYNFFPAVSAGWMISNEDFFNNNAVFDLLKIRASWGVSGSDLLPHDDLDEQDVYTFGGGYWFQDSNNGQTGFQERQLYTPNFTVETSNKVNFGVDTRIYDHLNLTADLFYARRTNILTNTYGLISEVIGIGRPQRTDGIVENKGLEAQLTWEDTAGDFTYHIGGQFSFARNKMVEINEPYRPHAYLERTGQQVGQRFGLQAIGFFEDQQDIADSPQQVFAEIRPGDIKYKDQNGDGVINQFDEVPLGYASGYPEMYFSASLGFKYKGISVSALFQGTGNYTAYINTASVYWPLQNDNTISNYYYNHRWTPETSVSATLPRLTTQSNDNNFRPNSVWLVDKSYIKLRNLEIAYSLPISTVESLKMNTVRIVAQGSNLFSIDDIPALDPEHLNTGYPILRAFSLGIDISF